ncbi:hypothetical protein G4G31_15760 [Massilia sp. Se16.2.3]|nr:hypothetical protein G4G31_15760 [Massilia sp. Se16.2.3]
MSNWTEYLASHGARFHIDEASQVEDFGRTLTTADLSAGFVAPVTDLGLIAVAGEDAASFLHKQLTNDVEHLGTGEARLAGFCTPKGRLQATFLIWRDSEGTVWLQLPRALQAPPAKAPVDVRAACRGQAARRHRRGASHRGARCRRRGRRSGPCARPGWPCRARRWA